MEKKLSNAIHRLKKDTLKMQALNLDEWHAIKARQNTIQGYQALNYILLYNSPALKNKSVIPKKYRIPASKFLSIYKQTLIKLGDENK